MIDDAQWRSWIEAPRWLDIKGQLEATARGFGLELKAEVGTGWIGESVFFSVRGPRNDVVAFRDCVDNMLGGQDAIIG